MNDQTCNKRLALVGISVGGSRSCAGNASLGDCCKDVAQTVRLVSHQYIFMFTSPDQWCKQEDRPIISHVQPQNSPSTGGGTLTIFGTGFSDCSPNEELYQPIPSMAVSRGGGFAPSGAVDDSWASECDYIGHSDTSALCKIPSAPGGSVVGLSIPVIQRGLVRCGVNPSGPVE